MPLATTVRRALRVAAATLLAGLAAPLGAVAQRGAEPALPGASGPQFERLGPPPHDNAIVEAFLYQTPEQAAVGAVRPRRFPSGSTQLNLDLRLKAMPRMGVRVRYEILTRAGPLEMRDRALVFMDWLSDQQVASMDFELIPAGGVFPDGPYQLRVFMNDEAVAVLNWSVGDR